MFVPLTEQWRDLVGRTEGMPSTCCRPEYPIQCLIRGKLSPFASKVSEGELSRLFRELFCVGNEVVAEGIGPRDSHLAGDEQGEAGGTEKAKVSAALLKLLM